MASKSEDPRQDSGAPLPDSGGEPTYSAGSYEATGATSLPAAGSEGSSTPATSKPGPQKVPHTRAGAWWTALIAGTLLLVLLLVFIIQNQESTRIMVLFWEWNMPLGVALLAAAILGVLIAVCIGGVRILQLRRAARKVR